MQVLFVSIGLTWPAVIRTYYKSCYQFLALTLSVVIGGDAPDGAAAAASIASGLRQAYPWAPHCLCGVKPQLIACSVSIVDNSVADHILGVSHGFQAVTGMIVDRDYLFKKSVAWFILDSVTPHVW